MLTGEAPLAYMSMPVTQQDQLLVFLGFRVRGVQKPRVEAFLVFGV